MNCEVCEKGVGVAKCKKCGKAICKNCGRFCPNCKSAVCVSHLVRHKNGMWMCELCINPPQRERSIPIQQRTAPGITPAQKPQVKETLSFEDLTKEIGEITIKIPTEGVETQGREYENVEMSPPLTPAVEEKEIINPFAGEALPATKRLKDVEAPKQEQGYKHLRRKPSDDPKEFRILTASAPKPTPMWVSGLISGILAFALCIPLFKNTAFPMFPKLFAYSVLILAGGTIIWNGYGLLFDENTKVNRLLCIPGLVLGIITAVVAVLYGLR
ncbi:MAG: hypothetical protein N3G21_09675 [Candidatus Hydrogenedentes bacterium]|nr:hypothetical protein [Candidatus Hydrogenedentota bacterium]